MVRLAASLIIGALLGALVGAQPIELDKRNYAAVNPNQPKVVTVTKTVTVTARQGDYVARPTPAPVVPKPNVPAPGLPAWQYEMLNQLNVIRRAARKDPVQLDPKIVAIAQEHSQEQSMRKALVHLNSGGTLGQRYARAGFNWRGAAENIAWNQQSPSQAMNAWAKSPPHYANMIGNYNYVGFGFSNYYWTQDLLLV
ncbi:hypothetical protein LPJ61_002591 [Coemansia biformis]|uniref:SCP domain-containing protein n=1 Tax=Coemansia biformis TaxID=1286918 RepID=A0A9W8CX29_9FUNG|nr:hypothetical protein LPJ61_002591 [Coemansia biformis]